MPRPSGRDDSAKLRGLAGELGFDLVKLPNRDSWQIIDTHGTPLRNPKIDATGFRTREAIDHLGKLKRDREGR